MHSDRRSSSQRPVLRITAVTILIASGAATTLASPTQIDEIVVVGSKTERPLHTVAGQVAAFDRERLEREQVHDLGDVTRYEPALDADRQTPRFGTTGISIRGVGGNRVAYEFDGVPLPARFAVGNFADSGRLVVDPAILSRVEILRGPASVLYGSDAIGGVVVLTSVDPHELVAPGRSVHAGAGLGYFGAVDGSLARATGAWSGESDGLLISVLRRSGHEPRNRGRGVADDRIDADQWQLFAKWMRESDAGGTLRLSADVFLREVDSDVRSLLGYERFAMTERLRGDDEQRSGRVTLDYRLPPLRWLDEGTFLLYAQGLDTEQRTDERRTAPAGPLRLQRDFFLRERGNGSEIRTRRDFVAGPLQHVVVAGFEWDRRALRQRRDGLQTQLATGAMTKTLLGEVFPLRDMPQTRDDRVGLYFQDEIIYSAFSLIPGLRWDYFRLESQTDALVRDPTRLTDMSNDHLSLRLGSTARATEALSFFAGYAEGFRAPPAEDVNVLLDLPQIGARALPNPNLRPEQSRNVEVGARWRDPGLTASAGFYFARYDDFIESRARIDTDPDSGLLLFQSRNIERATIYGTEADARIDLDQVSPRLRDWSIDGGVHWARGENEVAEQPLNSVAPLKAIAGLRHRWESLALTSELRLTYLARQTRVDRSQREPFVPPSAVVLDFFACWAPAEWIDLHASVRNLNNERYWYYNDVERYGRDDPRVQIATQPGVHANVTLNLRY